MVVQSRIVGNQREIRADVSDFADRSEFAEIVVVFFFSPTRLVELRIYELLQGKCAVRGTVKIRFLVTRAVTDFPDCASGRRDIVFPGGTVRLEKHGESRIVPGIVAHLGHDIVAVVGGVKDGIVPQLFQIAFAGGIVCAGARFVQCGQHDRRQNRDDRYHHYDHLLNIQYGVY